MRLAAACLPETVLEQSRGVEGKRNDLSEGAEPAEQELTPVTLLTAPVVLGSVRGSLQTLVLVPREKFPL